MVRHILPLLGTVQVELAGSRDIRRFLPDRFPLCAAGQQQEQQCSQDARDDMFDFRDGPVGINALYKDNK